MNPSRAMIPGEILCSWLGIVLAFFGGLHDGWLHGVLVERGGAMIWLITLGIPALVSMCLGAREWGAKKAWQFNMVRRGAVVKWRARAVMVQGLCWLYAIYLCFAADVLLIGCIGMVCFSFCAWSYLENRRTCREIRYATTVALP